MAWYFDGNSLVQSNGNNIWWKTIYDPGDEVPVSGIYKCQGCRKEITSNSGDPFPPQNHHQHDRAQGAIRWKLIVRTNTNGD
ncbi:protein L [Methylobacillus arboreus]|uniref:protein L n=1 Tax=Methylobacillus arboreus TaxID=755170 RepID=UPI001E3E1C15|nr:protein L [Methylobacillus arboreus]MCB5191787.1 protein L [Methylobacillus arboreus]